MFGETRFLIQLFFKMKFNYICIRDNSHVEPANCTLYAPQKAKQVHPSGRFYQRLEIISAAKWGEPVLFFTLLVLILNHSLFGQNEKPFNPVKGGNSKYSKHPYVVEMSRNVKADNGRLVAEARPHNDRKVHTLMLAEHLKGGPGPELVNWVEELKEVLNSR
jgi:hypothetical protein